MSLLIEEAISMELVSPVKRQSPTGELFDYYGLGRSWSDYCGVTIIRSGDAMVQPLFDLMPGVAIGKVLI
jgi:uracil phosphoribosyltransferase